MKNATKWVSLMVASAICVSSVAMLAACNKDDPETVEYTVTYYDGTEVLKSNEMDADQGRLRIRRLVCYAQFCTYFPV